MASDPVQEPSLRVLPRLLTGFGGLGVDAFVKLMYAMSSFVPFATQSLCLNVRWKKRATCAAPCVVLCPSRAISVADSVLIDPAKCISCNICATSCPHGVFEPRIPSDSSLYNGIIAARRKGKSTIRFSCDRCGGRYGKPERRGVRGAETIVLPCLGSLSDVLPIYAARLGCKVVIDPCPEDCGFSEGRKCYSLAMRRLCSVRESFVVRAYGDPPASEIGRAEGLERRRFLLSVGEAALKVLFDLEEPRGGAQSHDPYAQSLPHRRRELLILAQGLEPIPRNVGFDDYPILRIRIDSASCDLCGVCSKICPTGALRTRVKGTRSSIAFSAGACTGCRLCIEVCPKGCLSSSDAALSDINSEEVALVEKETCECRRCGFRRVRDASSADEDHCPMCEKKRTLVPA